MLHILMLFNWIMQFQYCLIIRVRMILSWKPCNIMYRVWYLPKMWGRWIGKPLNCINIVILTMCRVWLKNSTVILFDLFVRDCLWNITSIVHPSGSTTVHQRFTTHICDIISHITPSSPHLWTVYLPLCGSISIWKYSQVGRHLLLLLCCQDKLISVFLSCMTELFRIADWEVSAIAVVVLMWTL